ncbi:ABC transporter ATP-binding protein [Salsuginibacillus halophilus]
MCLMLFELSVELAQPFIISRIIDDGIIQEDMSVVLTWGGVLVGMSFIAFAAGVINSFYAAHVSQSIGYQIRQRLYERVQSFSFLNFQAYPVSSLLTRMTNDITQIQNTIFMSLRIMMRAPLLVFGSVVMAMIVNIQLGLVLLFSVTVLIIFLGFVMVRASERFKQVQKQVDEVNRKVKENIAAMRLIKVFRRHTFEKANFHDSAGVLKERMVKALKTVEFSMPVILLFMNMSIMAILWFGTVQVNTGGASVGEVVAIINYATRIIGAISVFAMIIMVFSRSHASIQRVGEILDTEDDIQDLGYQQGSQGNSNIAFENVTFRYPESPQTVLSNVSFHVKPGERVAVMGATGAGKTTLFQLIPRLYEAETGRVLINHRPAEDYSLQQLRQMIGYVSQETVLFTGTIRENIAWGKNGASDEEIVQAAQAAQIHDTIVELPDGYNTRLGQRGINLSGGQKQRISIARALLREPAILLLDDSTSALDMKTEARLMEALQAYRCTTLMITQKIQAAARADKVILLEDGKVTGDAHHEKLLAQSELYAKIEASQVGREVKDYA